MKKVLLSLICFFFGITMASAQMNEVTISSATASSAQSGEEASRVLDGNLGTLWHSSYYSTSFPVTFTISFASPTKVDIVRYIPRADGNPNGNWNEATLQYRTSTTASWVTVDTYFLGGSSGAYDFEIPSDVEAVQSVRFLILSGNNNFASAAEIEAYTLDTSKQEAFAQYFTDDLFTELRSGVTSADAIEDADVKSLVQNILADKTGYSKFRVGEYEPYRTVASLKEELKTSAYYNQWENPTGIYLKEGDVCYVAVSGMTADKAVLKVKNWLDSEVESTYPLRNGLNEIEATTEGNVFVSYYTDDYHTAPNIKLHFINAPVRGYWDSATMTDDDWKEMLSPLTSDNSIIIVRGTYSQLAFPVSAWKSYCPEDITAVVANYDKVQMAEREMMGLEKFGRQTKNRQLFYATSYGFMAATSSGAYCNVSSLKNIMKGDPADFGFWAVGHEWGHNNQIQGFHWSGCGETTNNIYASWAQIQNTTGNLRLEDEVSGIDEYQNMRGGRMQTYFEEALRKGVQWQLQDGPDYYNATPTTKTVNDYDYDGNYIGTVETTSRNYDHFVKLTPFWQMNLWGTLAGKCPDIIPTVIERIRTTSNYTTTYNTNGKQQVNWMKLACDASQLNLLPFFEKAGMLRPISAYIEDYGAGWNKISQAMIDELKDYVAERGYADVTEEINYINGHNYQIYRDRLPLTVPTTLGEGCSFSDGFVTVQHSQVQNAVAFETYNAQDELIRITMYGLGSDDAHSYTKVLYPSSSLVAKAAAYVMAVGYDGTRKKIFEKRAKVLVPGKNYTLLSNGRGGVLSSGASTSISTSDVVSWSVARATASSSSIDQIWQVVQDEDGYFVLYSPQSDSYFTASESGTIDALVELDDAPKWNVSCVDEDQSTYVFNKVGTSLYINAFTATETGLWGDGASDPNNIWTVSEVESVPLTIPAHGHALVCYPFNVRLPEDVVAYTVGSCLQASLGGEQYTFALMDEILGGILPAREPAVLMAPQGTYQLVPTAEQVADDVLPAAENLLQGTTLKRTGLKRGTFLATLAAAYVAGANCSLSTATYATTVAANNAYLLTEDMGDDTTIYLLPRSLSTGVTGLSQSTLSEAPAIYDLRGCRVNRIQHGVFIVGGRKILR